MGKQKTKSSKHNNTIFDSDSSNSSDSECSSNSDSDQSSTDTNQQKTDKKLKEKIPIKVNHIVRKVKVSGLTRSINSSRWPIGQLLKNKSEDSIRNLNLKELTTIKQVVQSVEKLKQITSSNGYYQLPRSTAEAFKNCRAEIANLYSKNKKKELQHALLTICNKDNFRSLVDILTTNSDINRMNKVIIRRSVNKNDFRK